MKPAFVLVLALAVATPALYVPTLADAQVRVGSGGMARRSPPRPRPRLSEAEQERLIAAEDEVFELDDKIADLEAANTAEGGLTEAQRTEWQSHTARRQAAQATVERLRAKQNG
ncbi:hypothetical protein [Brevundimonas sp.]|uniref:hypothetical protein n=1 Tax=Brevundimonas sp. TaxID=1871086 RepID=UPI003D6D2F4D